MNITTFSQEDIPQAARLWNENISTGEMIYAPLKEEDLRKKFWGHEQSSEEYILSAKENDELIGFAAGLIKRRYLQKENFFNTPFYITMVLRAPEHHNQGIGSALLAELEHRASSAGKHRAAITYRNPLTLTWEIPNSGGALHNNAPGVDIESKAYSFFSSKGYKETRIENGMYMPLDQFKIKDDVLKKEADLAPQGIKITHYDADRHIGFEELFDALHGEVWRQSIRDNSARSHPLPVLVAVEENRIIGFAGPIDKETCGRGWFNGIATHPLYERRGIATVLFHHLMAEFRSIGARYSTLFTDEENPALHLYRSVGFSVRRKFSVMEKEI